MVVHVCFYDKYCLLVCLVLIAHSIFRTWGYTTTLPDDYDEMYDRIGVGVKRINEIYPAGKNTV